MHTMLQLFIIGSYICLVSNIGFRMQELLILGNSEMLTREHRFEAESTRDGYHKYAI